MHPDTINRLDGPDFLEAIADTEAGDDRLINAAAYRERSLEWKRDKQQIAKLQTALEAATLALAQAQRRRDHQPRLRHAITPSGSR